MGIRDLLLSRFGERRVLVALGGLYMVVGAGWLAHRLPTTASPVGELVITLLITAPGAGIAYAGYRLPAYNVRTDCFAVVLAWCVTGLGTMIGILTLFHLRPGGGLSSPIQNTLILTALGSFAGLGVGIHDGRAKSRALEIERRNQELEQVNERLEEFTSVISHDLRNPLNVADGRLTLAKEDCDSPHLDDVAEAHDRMATLIDHLLTLAREGQSVGETEPVELTALAETCWQHATSEATIDLPDDDLQLQGDPRRLGQLLENLFRNAIEHGSDDVTISIGPLENGFYVADDGPGIPPGDRTAVFETGYTTRDGGTGFGLSIVKRIVEAHGWDIRITESEPGGARFEITGVAGMGPEAA